MDWTPDLAAGVGAALNEATIFGVDRDAASTLCRVLLKVLTLPETGPIYPDPRRVLALSGVTPVEALLREDRGRSRQVSDRRWHCPLLET